jgi:hypothetical protein
MMEPSPDGEGDAEKAPFVAIDLEDGAGGPPEAPVGFETLPVYNPAVNPRPKAPTILTKFMDSLDHLKASAFSSALHPSPEKGAKKKKKKKRQRKDRFVDDVERREEDDVEGEEGEGEEEEEEEHEEDPPTSASELPVYTAKFCLTFSGTQNALSRDHRCAFAPDDLKKSFVPDVPDFNSPGRFWDDLEASGTSDVILLGASISCFDNGLPFAARLICESVAGWNSLAFKDGTRCALRLPACSQAQARIVLGDRRECAKEAFWSRLVLSYVESNIASKAVILTSRETSRNGLANQSECIVNVDSEIGQAIPFVADYPAVPDDPTHRYVPIPKVSETQISVAKRKLGYGALADLDGGLSFVLVPDKTQKWPDGEEDDASSIEYEIGANLEVYFSYT